MKKYGQEFFHDNKISHAGDAPSGSAYFSLNLQTGNIAIVLNDQRRGAASELGYAIEDNIFSQETKVDKELEKSPQSIGFFAKKMAKDDVEFQPTKAKKAAQEFASKPEKKPTASTDDFNITKPPVKGKS
jgi:hypothetical protein